MARAAFVFGVAVMVTFWAPVGRAAVYPCPSDPGFCYRDVGDDGCFDVGTDDGPINAEIEGSSSFPPVPPPGSIVCPPSVKLLAATADDIRLATPSGSSILFYAAKIEDVRSFELMSGDAILLGDLVFGFASTLLEAEGSIDVEKGAKLPIFFGGFFAESDAGNITMGEKASVRGAFVALHALGGDVDLLREQACV